MSTDLIKEYAKKLRLGWMYSNIDEELEKSVNLGTTPHEFLYDILQKEVLYRGENAKRARIKKAGFPYKKYLDDLDMDGLPESARYRLPELRTLSFIPKAQNVVAYGNPGTGKTHLAIGLGIEAINAGYTVAFYSVPNLVNKLKELKAHKNLLSIQKQFERCDLMILDELGYISFDKEGGELLFTHLSVRSERKSTIITTNLSFEKWKTIFNDSILTTAIVDRITHDSFVLNMIGDTKRFKKL